MSHYYILAGHTVAATFDTRQAAMKRLKYFAVGVGITIKKSQPIEGLTQNRASKKIILLKPGEFKLPV